jgi:hypothetical protein
MWGSNIQALSTEYRTVAVDQIEEIGRSICTKPVECLGDLLVWLNDVFDALGLQGGVNLAGPSYGRRVGGSICATFPCHAQQSRPPGPATLF